MHRPICIFLPNAKTLDPAPELKELFADEIGDHKLALISIAGSCREGKSFLLNFFISYLRAGGEPNWMQNVIRTGEDGFPYKRTSNSVTQGILIWPEYFKIRDARGEEIVVILMDTQGLYDANTSLKDSTSLFALSVMLSSLQIFNVKENIKADHLNNLELFTEFSRRISESSKEDPNSRQSPFQKLIFLVRDWQDPGEHAYGLEGGEARLRELFKDASVDGELGSMRDNIKSCFESIACFLMPHPGMKVARSTEFRGDLSDMDEDFKLYVRIFIEDILQPKNLRPKKLNGEELKVRQFAGFVSNYVQELRSGNYPTIERLFSLTVTAHNSAIVGKCYNEYSDRMSRDFDNNPVEPSQFESLHSKSRDKILANFRNSKMIGDKSAVDSALEDLEQRIDSFVKIYRELNCLNYAKMHDRNVIIGGAAGAATGVVVGMSSGGLIGAEIGGWMGVLLGGAGGAFVAAPAGYALGAAIGGALAAWPLVKIWLFN